MTNQRLKCGFLTLLLFYCWCWLEEKISMHLFKTISFACVRQKLDLAQQRFCNYAHPIMLLIILLNYWVISVALQDFPDSFLKERKVTCISSCSFYLWTNKLWHNLNRNAYRVFLFAFLFTQMYNICQLFSSFPQLTGFVPCAVSLPHYRVWSLPKF